MCDAVCDAIDTGAAAEGAEMNGAAEGEAAEGVEGAMKGTGVSTGASRGVSKGVSKGAAFDRIRCVVLAPCCHQGLSLAQYCNGGWLKDTCGVETEDDLDIIKQLIFATKQVFLYGLRVYYVLCTVYCVLLCTTVYMCTCVRVYVCTCVPYPVH